MKKHTRGILQELSSVSSKDHNDEFLLDNNKLVKAWTS